jgi:hypothetical protein
MRLFNGLFTIGASLPRPTRSAVLLLAVAILVVAALTPATNPALAAAPPARAAVLAWHDSGTPVPPAGFVPLARMETGTVGLLCADIVSRGLPSGLRLLGSPDDGSLLLVTRSTAAMVARGELPPAWSAAIESAREAGRAVAEPTSADLRAIPALAADRTVALLRLPSWLAVVADAPGCRAQRIDPAAPPAMKAAAGSEPLRPARAADPALLAALALAVDTDRMFTDLDTLSTRLHTRYATTPQFDTACQYALGVFQSLGLSASLDPFTGNGHAMTNVVAVKTGTLYPSRIVIISAHLDSTSPSPTTLAPGAEDNGSGAAAVLEAARLLANLACESTIEFILFDGEEQGMLGSSHYAAEADNLNLDIQAMLTMDMIGYNDPADADLWIEGFHQGTSSVWLMNQLDVNAQTYCNLSTYLYPYEGFGSDHAPFHQHGFSAVLAIENEWESYPCYHQTCDTVSHLDAGLLGKITGAVLVTAADLAGVYSPSSGIVPATSAAVARATLRVVPNPAHETAGVVLCLPAETTGRCEVYSAAGRRMAVLSEGRMPAGERILRWDGRDALGRTAAAGIYWAAWTGPGDGARVPIVLLK